MSARWAMAGLLLLTLGCRNLGPATMPVSPGKPQAPGAPLDLREPQYANRCGIDCGAGFHCDSASATCVADPVVTQTRDAGPAWLP